jgi:large subunit ribosomal protein L15
MGSGLGKTSTRGHKGARSVSGYSMMRGFEGGQMPLHRRLPKRGFTNIFRTEYTVLNLDRLVALGETELTLKAFQAKGYLKSRGELLKILGNGELTTAITVHAHRFSKTAREKIEKAGGKAVVVG